MGELVTVALFSDPGRAHLARATLEAHGIRAVLLDESMAWTYGPDVFPVRLAVWRADELRAREVLRTLLGECP